MPTWYADNGQYVTTKFFGMKINRYMHDHGVTAATLAKVAAKNYRNGSLNPKAFRHNPVSEEDILASPMLNHPLTSIDRKSTSELQSLMRISYAVFCLKKKKTKHTHSTLQQRRAN